MSRNKLEEIAVVWCIRPWSISLHYKGVVHFNHTLSFTYAWHRASPPLYAHLAGPRAIFSPNYPMGMGDWDEWPRHDATMMLGPRCKMGRSVLRPLLCLICLIVNHTCRRLGRFRDIHRWWVGSASLDYSIPGMRRPTQGS
jgi:hypothetical protein